MTVMPEPANLLILMSDEHSRKALGCYGNSLIQTPNLDRLAARGTPYRQTATMKSLRDDCRFTI